MPEPKSCHVTLFSAALRSQSAARATAMSFGLLAAAVHLTPAQPVAGNSSDSRRLLGLFLPKSEELRQLVARQKCVATVGCCTRHPEQCIGVPGKPASSMGSAAPRARLIPPEPAQHGTYECCGSRHPKPLGATFWRHPIAMTENNISATYDTLIRRMLQPFNGRIPWSVVRASAYDRDTCAVLRVSRNAVCKVHRAKQRRSDFRQVQEAGLFSLVRELASTGGGLPDLELAYCMGDGSKVVADEFAARRRWGGNSGCAEGTLFTSASFQQFRCQAQSQLPFLFWYREAIFGKWRSWDETTAGLRYTAGIIPWGWKKDVAFFRGSLNEGQTEAQCNASVRTRSSTSRCELYHMGIGMRSGEGLNQKRVVDYRLGDGKNFSEWAKYKYVIFAEGSEEWADRLKLLLQLNVVVLTQDLWCNEHYFWLMQPWVHYVPVGTRFEHLAHALRWLRENDDAARRIAANAVEFAKTHLSRQSLLSFHRKLLVGYAGLLGGGEPRPRLECPTSEELPANLPPKAQRLMRRNFTLCRRAPR